MKMLLVRIVSGSMLYAVASAATMPSAHGAPGRQAVRHPSPDDVPRPVSAPPSLAGEDRPDISRFLNVRRVTAQQLSPDGRQLAFITDTTGQPQLWIADGSPLGPRQLTFLESSVTFVDWSPDGRWIAYGSDRGGNEREGFYVITPDGTKEQELLPPGDSFRRWGAWSSDGRRIAFTSTERNGLDFDVYVMGVAADGQASAPQRVYDARGGVSVQAWHPTREALLLAHARGAGDNDLLFLDLASGRADPLLAPGEPARHQPVQVSPDGSHVYVATNHARDLTALARVDLATRVLTWVDTPAGEVEDVALSADGRWLAWVVNDNGYSRLHVRDTKDGRDLQAPEKLPRGVYAVSWATGAPVLCVRVTSAAIFGDVWALTPQDGGVTRLTSSATGGLDPARFSTPEAVSFRSHDGETVHGLLYVPRGQGTGARPPVLIGVHGGPTAQARPVYNPSFQYLLTRGIAVFDLNFRGSTGYGKRFQRLDDKRLRLNVMGDIATALDHLASTGRVDTSRAAIMGGSYGGYLAFAAVGQLPDRFRAAVSFVGVSNWITALEGASPGLKATDKIEYGDLSNPDERAFLEVLSPISHVDKVRAPIMVLHGANDPRDPVSESDAYVAALRARGRQVEYLRFPDEGHGIRKKANQVVAYRRIAAFLETQLK